MSALLLDVVEMAVVAQRVAEGSPPDGTSERATVLNHPIQLATVTKDHGEIETEHFIVAEKRGDQWLFGAMLTPIA